MSMYKGKLTDYILREDAIRALCKSTCYRGAFCPDEYCKEVREPLDDVPAADVQPVRKGKWNVYYHGDNKFSYSCNMCGYSSPYDLYLGEYSQKKWRFCPNCGARMDM